MRVPLVPDWFNLLRVAFFALSLLAMLVHLSAFDEQQRARHLEALKGLRDAVRNKAVSSLQLVQHGASFWLAALRALYGAGGVPRFRVSAGLAVVYLALSALLMVSQHRDLQTAQAVKQRLEDSLNPRKIYRADEVARALEMRAIPRLRRELDYVPMHSDERSVQVREAFDSLDKRWRRAVAQEPASEAIVMLTLVQGRVGSEGVQWLALVSLLAFTAVLDFLMVVGTMSILQQLSTSTSVWRYGGWSLALVSLSAMCCAVALVPATFYLRGETSAFLLYPVFLPLTILLLARTVSGIVEKLRTGEEEWPNILFGLLASTAAALYVGHRIAEVGWVTPPLPSPERLGPWTLAFTCIAPGVAALCAVAVCWLTGILGSVVLWPLHLYLRVSGEANKAISVGLCALPAGIIQVVHALWTYLAGRK